MWNDDQARFSGVEETWLARTPLRGRKVASMPFMGSAWKRIDLSNVQRVVVSSHAFSHHLASRAAESGIPAFAYIHSPARYVWAPDLDSRGRSIAARIGRPYFRWWDRRHAAREVHYAANSRFVADRIADAWGVSASVVYPPVDIERITGSSGELCDEEIATIRALPELFVLGASRFVAYKNLDAAIRAGEILGLPVVLAGAGPDEPRLRALAKEAQTPVTFVGRVSDNALIELYRRAALFVYMAVEDFGIMPVEAMACGTPVLINEIGGARESVLAVSGGVASHWRNSHFDDRSLVEEAASIDMNAAMAAVTQFSNASFRRRLISWLDGD
ncbi:glycosyltransferase [Mycolicibacterium sp. XJ883]